MNLSTEHIRLLRQVGPKLQSALLKLKRRNESAVVALELLAPTFKLIETEGSINAVSKVPAWHLFLRAEYEGFGLTGEQSVVDLFSVFQALLKGRELSPELIERADA